MAKEKNYSDKWIEEEAARKAVKPDYDPEIVKNIYKYFQLVYDEKSGVYTGLRYNHRFFPYNNILGRKNRPQIRERIKKEDVRLIWKPLEMIANSFNMYMTVCEKYPNFEHQGIEANAFIPKDISILLEREEKRDKKTFGSIKFYEIQFCKIPGSR